MDGVSVKWGDGAMKLTTIHDYGACVVYDDYRDENKLFEFAQTLLRLIERNSDLEFTSVEWCEGDGEICGRLRFDIEKKEKG